MEMLLNEKLGSLRINKKGKKALEFYRAFINPICYNITEIFIDVVIDVEIMFWVSNYIRKFTIVEIMRSIN